MKSVISLIIGILIIGIVVLLCLFSCIMAGKSDEYWDELKQRMEKNK